MALTKLRNWNILILSLVLCRRGSVVLVLEGSPVVSKQFVTAGKAVFTVQSVTGRHYTYRVSDNPYRTGVRKSWFVSLLTGPDNTSDYTYLGMLDESGNYWPTRKTTLPESSEPVRVLRWALRLVFTGGQVPAGYSLFHAGRCGRCGRQLTTPESVAAGLGPDCLMAE